MPTTRWPMLLVTLPVLLGWLVIGGPRPSTAAGEQTGTAAAGDTRAFAAPEAHQAAAACDDFFYAITNRGIAKYARDDGRRVALSDGPAKHLNSGFFWEGRLYCAHSNYPATPEQSQIMVLDPETMRLTVKHDFGDFGGSLTWVIRNADGWWCNFAYYGADNARTYLVQLDDDWRELRRFRYPERLIRGLGRYSVSGGIWDDGRLLVTGHDDRLLFELRLPGEGDELEYVDRHPVPFTGQGIARDPRTGGLVGIDRGRRLVIFAPLP